MKVLHVIGGAEIGGSKNHLISLLKELNHEEVMLGVFEKGEIYEEAIQAGVKVSWFDQRSRYDLSVLRRVQQLIEEEGIKIVHTHGPRANLFGYMVRKMTPFIWVTTVHSDPRNDFLGRGIKGKIFTALNLKMLKKMDHYFAISSRFKTMLESFGVPGNKITTIYNGISFRDVYKAKLTREDMDVKESDFIVTMVARLDPVKGHVHAIRAIKKIVATHPETQLWLVGDGPYEEELRKEVVQLGVEQHVRFLGHQDDVHSLLAISDIELLTSYSESFPLVILEAARAHIPVISTDVGGVKDLMSEPALGWVIPIKDEQAIQQAIEEAIQCKQDGTLPAYGDRLYEKASTHYSLEQFVHSVEKAYEQLLK